MVDAVKRDAHTCLDAETIAAFIDGKLAGHARTRVVEHLADCADCYFVFSESARASAASGAEAGHGRSLFRTVAAWLARPQVMWPSGALAAAAIVFAFVLPFMQGQPRRLTALVAAVGTERTVEPRLTGGFAYGRLAVTRGAAAERSPEVRIAVANIDKAVGERRTPANLDAAGIAHLVTGSPSDGVAALESATRDAPDEPRYWSDLAAAYVVRARAGGALDDSVSALNAADRATRLAPKMPEAWFNRALALEQIPAMRDRVKAAWDDYLNVDSTSEWADEAKQHIARLGSL